MAAATVAEVVGPHSFVLTVNAFPLSSTHPSEGQMQAQPAAARTQAQWAAWMLVRPLWIRAPVTITFTAVKVPISLSVLAPVASRAIAQAVPHFAPVVKAAVLSPVALVLNLVVRTACVTAVITAVAISKAMRVDTAQIPLAMVSTAATDSAKRGQSHFAP